jgi:GT2 family glycosyltransferase
MVEQEFPAVRLIKNTENHGFSKANNQALAKASGRYLLLLNSDTQITDNAFLQMMQFMEAHPSVGIAGPQLLNPDGTRQYSCDYFPLRPLMLLRDKILDCCWPRNRVSRQAKMREWDYATNFKVNYLIGAVLMIRRETFERIGPLDEQFFMYAEDIDWCYRSVFAGWKNYYLGETRVVHYNRGSSEKTAAQAQRLIHLRTSSLLRFYKKHYGILSACLLRINIVFNRHG